MDSLGFQSGFYDNDPSRSLLLSGSALAEAGGQMGSPIAAADARTMMLMKQKQAALQQEQAMMSMSMPMPMMANSANLEMEMMMMKEQQAMQQQQRAMMMGMPSGAAACNMEMEMMMRRNARAQQIEQIELQQRQQQQIQMQYERQMMQQGRQQRQQEQQMLLQQSQKVNVEQQANMLRQLELMKRMDKAGEDGGSNKSKSSNFKQSPDEIPSSLKSVAGAGAVGTGRGGGGIFVVGGDSGCFPVKPLSGGNGVAATRNSFSALVNRGAALAAPADINFSIGVTSSAKLSDMQMDRILKDGTNKLVSVNDRDLISDALLISIAQLEPCTFRDRDRVGCYKTRPMGFVGLSCKHCGGQPGFGRFFPNSVRSLAQTTTSQTIIKHIATNCPSVPVPIREVVQDCQRQELEIAVHNDNLNAGNGGSSKRVTRYGSRKIFFQGLWSRLHDNIGKTLVDKKTDEQENQGGEGHRPDDDTSNKPPELHDSSTTAAESLNGLHGEEEASLSKEGDGDNENRKDASLKNKKKKRERSQQHCDKEEGDDGTPGTKKRPRVDA